VGRSRLGPVGEAPPHILHRTWPGADSQTRTGHTTSGGERRTRYKTSGPRDSQSHSSGRAWSVPLARRCWRPDQSWERAHLGWAPHPCAGWVVCTPCVVPCQEKSIRIPAERAYEPVALWTHVTSAASAPRAARSMARGRWSSCATLLERLAQGCEDMARAPWHVAPAYPGTSSLLRPMAIALPAPLGPSRGAISSAGSSGPPP